MKQIILSVALAVAIFAQPSCKKSTNTVVQHDTTVIAPTTSAIKVANGTLQDYQIYIDGVLKGVVTSLHGSQWQAAYGNHACRAVLYNATCTSCTPEFNQTVTNSATAYGYFNLY
jgi:hypothetical protein